MENEVTLKQIEKIVQQAQLEMRALLITFTSDCTS